jgi:hypothetical protein
VISIVLTKGVSRPCLLRSDADIPEKAIIELAQIVKARAANAPPDLGLADAMAPPIERAHNARRELVH